MSGPTKTPLQKLLTPVQYLKGIGPQRGELLNRLGLKTAADILFFFPRDYQDASQLVNIADVEDGTTVSICGTVEEVELRNIGPGRTYLGVLVRDKTEHARAVWFNQPFMRKRFFTGQRLLLTGLVKINGLRPELHHPSLQQLADDDEANPGGIVPVYSLTEGLRQHQLHRITKRVVDEYASLLEETLPNSVRTKHDLIDLEQAIRGIHFPRDAAHLEAARKRLIFQELLVLQLGLSWRRNILASQYIAPALPTTALIDSRIRRRLPFALTSSQETVISELTADIARTTPMNRLLHGEVGSGKTAVAVYAMLVAVAGGHQAAVLAPTEVLAQQHFDTLSALLNPVETTSKEGNATIAPSRVRLEMLTGSLTSIQRRTALTAIASGQVDIVVGTHAVLSDDVRFERLGLVVVDEQHKFGVRQRAELRQNADGNETNRVVPHTLLMTATPIPRTVSMTLFGDLEVSTLRGSPPGRQPVHTYIVFQQGEQRMATDHETPASPEDWWEFVRAKLRQGRQAYVIAPLIEESSDDTASVQAVFEHLANGELADFRLDLLHGRMTADEKHTVMDSFRRGHTQVLIATTVIEVGVDVPNATIMTIEDGQRFGLAQLHQLRGRVSRGKQPGYVCVLAAGESKDAGKRLEAFASTTSGFELSEIDFQLRGPGDLFGTRQHGMPPLLIADLQRDEQLLVQAREAALQLVQSEDWQSDEFVRLREMVARRYGAFLDLADVG